MNTKHIIFATTLFSTTMLVACDEGSPEPDSSDALEQSDAPLDRVLASIEPDPDTTIRFIEAGVEGDSTIDVVIIGRDGGPDYGALIGRGKATPLELYLAFAEGDQPIPDALQRHHDRTVPQRDILNPAQAAATVQDETWENLPSTFTCLNWTNFQTYMGTRFSSEMDRVETLSTNSAWHEVYNPAYQYVWEESEADMVVCNKDSYPDPYNGRRHGRRVLDQLGWSRELHLRGAR